MLRLYPRYSRAVTTLTGEQDRGSTGRKQQGHVIRIKIVEQLYGKRGNSKDQAAVARHSRAARAGEISARQQRGTVPQGPFPRKKNNDATCGSDSGEIRDLANEEEEICDCWRRRWV